MTHNGHIGGQVSPETLGGTKEPFTHLVCMVEGTGPLTV